MDWLNKYSEDVPKAQQGKTIAKKPIKSQSSATRQDSLDLYNQSKKVEKYYENRPGYKGSRQEFDETSDYAHIGNNNAYKSYVSSNATVIDPSGMKQQFFGISKDEYRKNIDKNKYLQREIYTGQLNGSAPMQLFDKRMQPKKSVEYTAETGDETKIFTYNTIANKPFDLLTSKEKEQRVKQYGREGVPNSYNKTNDKELKSISTSFKPQQPVFINDNTHQPAQTAVKKKAVKYWAEKDMGTEYWNEFIKKHPGALGLDPIRLDKFDQHMVVYPDKERIKINPIQNTLQPIGIQNNSQEFDPDLNMRIEPAHPKYYNVTDKVNQKFGGSETDYKYYPGDENSLPQLSEEKYEDGSPYNERTMTPVFQDGGTMTKTQGQLNAISREKKLKLHKQQLESNPNQLVNESDSNYAKRKEYNKFRIKQSEDKNPVKKWYNEMDASQEADSNFVTKTIRKVATSPIHGANYLHDLINTNDSQQYKSTKDKTHDFVKGAGSVIDMAGLVLLPGLDYGLKNAITPARQLLNIGVSQLYNQGAQDSVEDLVNYGIDKFQDGGPIDKNSPEYERAWKQGQVQNPEANGEENPYWGGQLDEVVIQNHRKEKGFWEQYRDKIVEENKDSGLLGAIIGTPISAITSLPQLAMMKALTGKMQRPSEAVGFDNQQGLFESPSSFGKHASNFVLDAVTDPANLIGAGVLTKENALARLAASKESGLLSNAYKINPFAFKSNPESAYRMIGGKEGYLDAINSGEIRALENGIYGDAHFNMELPLNPNRLSSEELLKAGSPEGYKGPYMAERKWANNAWNKHTMVDGFKDNPEMLQVLKDLGKDKDVWGKYGNLKTDDEAVKLYKEDWLQGYKEVPKTNQASSSAGIEDLLKSGYNKVSTGNSIIPYAWKSPAVGLTQEESYNIMKSVAGGENLSEAEKVLLAEYQYSSAPFTGRRGYVNQDKRQSLNNLIENNPSTFTGETVLTRRFDPKNKELFNIKNGKVDFGERPTSFSAGVGVESFGSGATDRFVLSGKNAKQVEQKFLKNNYKEISDNTYNNIENFTTVDDPNFTGKAKIFPNGNKIESLGEGFIRNLKNTEIEKELIAKELRFKRLGKVKNDIGGHDHIMKSYQKGGVIKDNNGYWNPKNHGKVVEIDQSHPDDFITMKGVNQNLIGISDTGDMQYMTPGNDYKFEGKKVREFPMAKNGKVVSKKWLDNY